MAESIGHPTPSGKQRAGLANWVTAQPGTRFILYLSDYLAMYLPFTQRYRELSMEHLACRFCGNSIELLGAWKCECGYKRPGNYFGRCPKCLGHPHYIDCPSCAFTMDVR